MYNPLADSWYQIDIHLVICLDKCRARENLSQWLVFRE